jgi:hypothetical protein
MKNLIIIMGGIMGGIMELWWKMAQKDKGLLHKNLPLLSNRRKKQRVEISQV